MVEFIHNLIGNEFWATIIMSLIPLIELKGGIVFARGVGFSFIEAIGLAYIGSTVVFIGVYFLLRPVLALLKKTKWFSKFALKIERYFADKADETLKKQEDGKKHAMSETLIKQLGVFIFVAIPLPMTGVWTGTAIAVFFDLKFKDVIWPIMLGNLVAGIIISVLAEICMQFWTIKSLDYILYALFALAVILFVFVVFKIMNKKTTVEKSEQGENE